MALAPVGIVFKSDGVTNLVRDLERIRKQLAEYANTAHRVGDEARKSATGIRAMNRAIVSEPAEQGAKNVRKLSTSFKELGQVINAPSQALGQIGQNVTSFGQRISSVGRNVIQAGAGISAAITLPVVLGFKTATTAALDFEKELIKLNTQIGLNASEVNVFSDAILGVGQSSLAINTATNSAELAGGAFAIASAGIKEASDALPLLEASAKASAIGLGETEQIARTAAGAMKAFGITGTEAVDTLVAIVREGNLEADSLAGTLGRVGGIANSLGVSFADAGAFIAAFTRSGASASEAVVSLRSILTTLAKEPTKGAAEALASVGTNIEAVRKSIQDDGLNVALLQLRQLFEDNDQTGVEFFKNIRAFSGFSFVTGLGEELEDINVSTRAASDGLGVVNEGFATLEQTAGFQIEKLKVTFNVLATSIGQILLPPLNELIQRIIPIVNALRLWANENPRLVQIAVVFAAIAASIGPLLIALGTLGLAVGGIISLFGTVISAIGAIISPIGLAITAVLGLAFALGGPLLLGLAEVSGIFDRTFTDIASSMFAWGREIVVQFARGMINGLIAVIDALNTIGQAIAFWLSPGSPPRLLPDIDKWGTAAMNEFLDGFTLANFDTFDEVADITEKIIRAGVDKITEGTIDGITEFRERIANAVSQISSITTGGVGFLALAESIGFANSRLTEYTATMFELESVSLAVARAQEEIERINQNFTQAVAPLNDELDAIEARRDEVRRQQRNEELQSILDDESAPALAKELALLELREQELTDQIGVEEQLRDAALEEADAKLAALEAEQAALKEQAELQLRVIEAQLRQNELLDESKEAIEKLAGAIGGLADSIGGLGGIGGAGLGLDEFGFEEFDFGELITDDLQDATDTIVSEFSQLFADLQALIQPLIDKFLELKETWAGVVQLLIDSGDDLDDTKTKIDGLVQLMEDLTTNFLTFINEVKVPFGELVGTIDGESTVIQKAIQRIIDVVSSDLNDEDSFIAKVLLALQEFAFYISGEFIETYTAFLSFWVSGFTAVFNFISIFLTNTFLFYKGLFTLFFVDTEEGFRLMSASIVNIWFGFWHTLERILTIFGELIETMIGEDLEAARKLYEDFKKEVLDVFQSLVDDLSADDFVQRFTDIGSNIMEGMKQGIVNKAASLKQAIIDAVNGLVSGASEALDENSPSRVMMKIGEFAGEGLAIGIRNSMGLVSRTAHNLGAVVAPAAISAQPIVSNQANVNMGGVTINNGMDELIFEARVRSILTNALGETL